MQHGEGEGGEREREERVRERKGREKFWPQLLCGLRAYTK